MPRPTPPRSIGGETNLAERIRRELDGRGWTPAELARRMTEAGCGIGTSSMYKVLDRDKPRSISVDELVALATVFGTSVEELLTPVELIDKQRARELVEALDSASSQIQVAIDSRFMAYVGLLRLAAENQGELFDYVHGHYFRHEAEGQGDDGSVIVVSDEAGRRIDVDETKLHAALIQLDEAIIETAADTVRVEKGMA